MAIQTRLAPAPARAPRHVTVTTLGAHAHAARALGASSGAPVVFRLSSVGAASEGRGTLLLALPRAAEGWHGGFLFLGLAFSFLFSVLFSTSEEKGLFFLHSSAVRKLEAPRLEEEGPVQGRLASRVY